MTFHRNPLNRIVFSFLFSAFCWGLCNATAFASPEHPVVVIDPGHGGENMGGEYGDFTEKFITQITADAMAEELSRYDNVTVYLTRNADVDLSLKERCDIASSHDADLLICLHYNLSENHTLFGAECWVSMFDPYYREGYALASEFIHQFKERGLFIRGIKTRMNSKGTDYYGILRESVDLGLQTVLVEHAHMDEDRDVSFCDEEEDWICFGKMDATAVAKYLGLSSEELGVDYSDHVRTYPEVVTSKMVPDESAPIISELSLESIRMDEPVTVTGNDEKIAFTGEATFTLEGMDPESGLLYYDYSLDGIHFSPLQPFCEGGDPESIKQGSVTFTVPVEKAKVSPRVVCRVYNGYDLDTLSNEVVLEELSFTQKELDLLEGRTALVQAEPSVDERAGEDQSFESDVEEITTLQVPSEETKQPMDREQKILITLVSLLALAGLLFTLGLVLLIRHVFRDQKRKRKNHNDPFG
ncbi:MAG: N-acetylmuramoyl-L-alanine amidase [Lachnospiraceae bacterium]|nr:N-acetylmuramoyl-L-alanine amidase [Lachnospiraceae bacterium]